MNSHEEYEFIQCMNSYDRYEFLQCTNSRDWSDKHCMNSHVPRCVFVPDRTTNWLTDSYIKINNLDDTQECLSISNHKIAFDYDEYTMQFAEELTLDTSEVLLSNNTLSLAGNATIAF
jgi:hypothetical protein